jgi:hypothetical protein
MVSGKPSNQSTREADSSPTTRLLLFIYTHRRVGVCSAEQMGIRSYSHAVDVCPAYWMWVWSCNRFGGIVPRPGMKGKRLLQNDLLVFQACKLGLPCKG